MNPERWKQIDELFEIVLDLEPDKRAAYLDEVCAGDEALKKEVETLLASDNGPHSYIEASPMKIAVDLLSRQKEKINPGESIGPYKILSLIGTGGMGEVYRANDPRIGREIAIKVLPPHFSNDSDRMRRFQQEVRAAGMLNHQNIVAIYDSGMEQGSPYLVSELLRGESLRQKLQGAPLPIRKAIEYAFQISKGLSAAHEKGIVHRDLKPENIFITREGAVKILDFGLAKLTHQTDRTLRWILVHRQVSKRIPELLLERLFICLQNRYVGQKWIIVPTFLLLGQFYTRCYAANVLFKARLKWK